MWRGDFYGNEAPSDPSLPDIPKDKITRVFLFSLKQKKTILIKNINYILVHLGYDVHSAFLYTHLSDVCTQCWSLTAPRALCPTGGLSCWLCTALADACLWSLPCVHLCIHLDSDFKKWISKHTQYMYTLLYVRLTIDN